jgi:hypothetical protein
VEAGVSSRYRYIGRAPGVNRMYSFIQASVSYKYMYTGMVTSRYTYISKL